MTTTETETAGKQPDVPEHTTLKKRVEEFLDVTLEARSLSERCRDYKDGKQWTAAQIQELKRRRQAPIVNNRIKTKHNGLMGLAGMNKSEPKAFPRNVPNDDGAADACTDGLRYAGQKANLKGTFSAVYDNFFCEGSGGVDIRVETNARGEIDVTIDHIPWDRMFYDAFSRKHDFDDARDKGYVMWMDEEDITAAFPDADPEALSISSELAESGDTFDDKPSWFITRGIRNRHLVATHYYKWKGKWCLAIYTGSGYLLPPMVSPYLDEDGQPTCTLEYVSAYTDRYNNRYGELVSSLDLQDEINHRRSKALFLLSQRQTFSNRGAVVDVKKAKRELAKPDGHLEVGQGEFGKDFGILPTGDMAEGQFQLLQEAKAEIDAQSYNAQMSGQRQQGDLSGVAIGKLQQAGVVELNDLLDHLTAFRLRVYRQMWWRIRQFWDQEKWVRVTDDEQAPRWVGFNVQVLLGDYLKEIMNDENKPYAMRLGASAQLVQLEQQNPQALQQPVMVKNRPAELDMDIILDESYDAINNSQEQLDMILKYGAAQQFNLIDVLEISNIPGKRQLIKKLEQRQQEQAQTPNPQAIAEQQKAQNEKAKVSIDAQRAQTDQYKATTDAHLRYMEIVTNHSKQPPTAEETAAANRKAAPVQIVMSRDSVGSAMDDMSTREAAQKAKEEERELAIKNAEMTQTAAIATAIVQAVTQQTHAVARQTQATEQLVAAVKAPKTGKITKDANGDKTVEVT